VNFQSFQLFCRTKLSQLASFLSSKNALKLTFGIAKCKTCPGEDPAFKGRGKDGKGKGEKRRRVGEGEVKGLDEGRGKDGKI